jgi:hypothetical protein
MQREGGDVFRLADGPCRNLGEQDRKERCNDLFHHHRRPDPAGCDRVDADPGSDHLARHRPGKADQSALDDTILLSRSTDGGHHWSTPVAVNHTTAGKQAFTASVHVSSNGDVAVTYYDFRNDSSDDAALSTATG